MRWFFFLSAVLLLSFGCTKPNTIDWDKVFGDKDAAASSDDDSVAGDDLQPDETLPDDLTDEEVTDETGEEETPDEEEDAATEQEPDSADTVEPEGDEPDPVDDEEITDAEEETPEGEEEVGDDATAPDDDLPDLSEVEGVPDEDMIEADAWEADMVEADAWEADIVEADTVDEDIVPDVDLMPVLCTGQTKCYDGTVEITCPTTGNDFYGQDSQYAALGYCTPRSYSISGTAGNDIVTDNVTGLIWQRTVNTNTYTWAEAITYCENLTYGGQTDWRLPSRKELATLPDYDRYTPAIDTAIFPGTQSNSYWSSSSYANNTLYAWEVHFSYGDVPYTGKTVTSYARCVRGTPLPDSALTEATVIGKVIVTDTVTGLIWTKEYNSSITWQNALSYCENLDYGGVTDWRLPNIEELKTLIDDYSPDSIFPGMPLKSFWSSSSIAGYTDNAWCGLVSGDNKTNTNYARCVRGGFVSLCGDGTIDSNEFCDDGPLNGTNGYCTTSCNAILTRETKQWGTTSADYGYSTTVDGAGNIFVAGYTDGDLDGNTNAGGSDIFLTKWNTNGTKAWTKQWGSTGDDYGYSVAVDGAGNIFVAGYTDGGLDGNTNAGSYDIFLTKWNADGTKAWTKQWGTTNEDYSFSVAVDGAGNIFVAGRTRGGLDGNTNAGSTDLFLTKWNANGTKAWTKQWGTTDGEFCSLAAVDGAGNIFVVGRTFGGLDGNTNAGGTDVLLTKWNANGTKAWTKQWGTAGHDYGRWGAVDGAGNIFVSGHTGGPLDGNTSAGGQDIFLTKWNADGTKAWTKQWGAAGEDYGYSVAVDGAGNIFVAGYTDGGLDGNISASGLDIFLTKWNSGGVKQWTKQWGTTGDDRSYSVAVDGAGKIYVTGYTVGSLDGNTGAGSNDVFLSIINNE